MTIPEIVQLSRRAKAAIDRYRHDEAKLYDRRGFPRFPRDEHEARVQDLRAERNEVLREVEKRANEIAAWASREAAAATNFAPDTILEDAERRDVTSRLPLIEADVASLSEEELAERLQGVLRGGSSGASRVEMFAYAQVAKKRRREIVERKVRAAREATGNRPTATPIGTKITAIDGLLGELEKALLGPEAQRRAARWKEIAGEAGKVTELAFLRARDAQSYVGVLSQNSVGRKFAERQRREGFNPSAPTRGGHGSIADVNVRDGRSVALD